MIAIVPARGGSKGLPKKNIRRLIDKPMIAYTLIEALNSRYISEVIISTDDETIASIAVEYGAKCLFMRPAELARDDSLAVDNYIYTIDRLNNEFDYKITEFVVLQPTSPLRLAVDIDNVIELFYSKNADSAFSFTQEAHPISWHKKIDLNQKIIPIFDGELKNRQDVVATYFPNGAVYVFKYEVIKKRKYYTDNSFAHIMPADRSVDVDTISDFKYVEFLLRTRYEE
ncbi:MAG: acylneuraminate cytidylyltransferase family protein [Gammaproteobacteria bacterium]|nr:acylneuraminate cytidylyltransferase family protein [Gammaproteobacteria bacterium]